MAHSKPWDTTILPEGISHLDALIKYGPNRTRTDMSKMLGRSVPSIESKMRRLGIQWLPDITVQGTEEGEDEVCGIKRSFLLDVMKDKPQSLTDLSTKFDRSPETIRLAIEQLQISSYEIVQTGVREYMLSTKAPAIVVPPSILWDKPVWKFKFGVMSDSHWASKYAQMSGLIKIVDVMYEEGVRKILFCGDLSAGRDVYPGQILDVVSDRADKQLSLITTYWPKREDLDWYMLGGNHDWSLVKKVGFNLVNEVCKLRDDFHYAGFDLATVKVTPDIDAILWHPSGGVPYAISYRLQKMAEQTAIQQFMEAATKLVTPRARFLLGGHLHVMLEFWRGPMFCAQVGCFESQTNYLAKKGLFPELGAYIFEVELTKVTNMIRRLRIEHLRLTEIENDYLNYPLVEEQSVLEPMFQWVRGEE